MIFEEKARMIELIDFLNKHQDLYDKGTPEITDKEWDEAYFELQELERLGGYILPNSPTQKIRYEVVSELKKVKHEYQPMLSLDKTKDIEDVINLFGHSHRACGLYKPFGFNIGCDLNHFRLYSEKDIEFMLFMKNKYWDNDKNLNMKLI